MTLRLFDNLYFLMCRVYYRHKDDQAAFVALFLLSIIQTINIFSIWFLFGPPAFNLHNLKIAGVVVYLMLVVLNGFRYNKLHYKKLKERWESFDAISQKRKTTISKIYLVVSVLLVFITIYRNQLF